MDANSIRFGQYVTVKPSRLTGALPRSARVVERCQNLTMFRVIFADTGERATISVTDMEQ